MANHASPKRSFDELTGQRADANPADVIRDAKRQLKVRRARESLIPFQELTMPGKHDPFDSEQTRFQSKLHHRAIADAMERAYNREFPILIICMPPRSGKSQGVSIDFPCWLLGRDPYINVILGTYNEDLAKNFGRKVRAKLEAPYYQEIFPQTTLARGVKAADLLETEEGGMLAFVGRGGSTTGRGADFFIVDDPFKDRKEAKSPTIRNDVWEWYQDVVSTRLMSDTGVIVIMMTRWHEDDLVGRLTDPNNPHYVEEVAARIKILNLPALAEENDPLGREIGEALWPEKFSREYLERIRVANPRGFSALYQQRPSPEDGDDIKAEMLKTYQPHELPKVLRYYIGSDHAVKEKQANDWTCIIVAGVDSKGTVWIVHVEWRRIDTEKQVTAMLDVQAKYRATRWWAGKDQITGSIGPFLRRESRKRGIYLPLTELSEKEDKVQKAQSIIGMMARGEVRFPANAHWWPKAKQEMLKFPNAANDDFVDALANLGRGIDRIVAAVKPSEAAREYPTNTYGWVVQAAKREKAANDSNNMMRTG